MTLEDLDWRVGEIVVHGKGRRSDRLPLPSDVGEAITAYLRRGRPRSPGSSLPRSQVAPPSSERNSAPSSASITA